MNTLGAVALAGFVAAAGSDSSTATAKEPVRLSPAVEYEPGPSPFKGYVRKLFSPSGVQVLDDAPADHPHHHGLMFAAWVNRINFWAEHGPDTCGRQETVSLKAASGLVVHRLRWIAPDGRGLLEETRRIQSRGRDEWSPVFLSWQSCLRAAPGVTAQVHGAWYAGLGMRFVRDFAGAVEFLTPQGSSDRPVRGTERLLGGRWCVARGRVGGRPVTVALLDHPSNPPREHRWFVMDAPFAYMSGVLDVHDGKQERPIQVLGGETLCYTWAVALWDGWIEPASVEALWRTWSGATEDSPRLGSASRPSTAGLAARAHIGGERLRLRRKSDAHHSMGVKQ